VGGGLNSVRDSAAGSAQRKGSIASVGDMRDSVRDMEERKGSVASAGDSKDNEDVSVNEGDVCFTEDKESALEADKNTEQDRECKV